MSNWQANNFTGMNNWISPALLESNVPVSLIDATVSSGKISPINEPKILKGISSPESLGHYGNRNRSWVKFYDRTYWSINNAQQAPYYGGNVETLGIPYPENHPQPEAINPESGESGLTGKFKYCWTHVNVNGWESAPCAESGDLWTEITVSAKNIRITYSNDFPAGISYIKIYRTASNGADFYCVGKITATERSFTDKTADDTLVMLESASSFDNYPPPDHGKYLCSCAGVFFLAVGSKIYFSSLNNPHAWPTMNFIGVDDTITGMVEEFQGILVFTANRTYRVSGAYSSDTITCSKIPGNQGCRDYRTISSISNAPIWLSNDGICTWDGENISIISNKVIRNDHIHPICSVSADDCYYLFTINGAIVFDRRNGDIFRMLSFNCEYSWYDPDMDIMYMQKGGVIYQFGKGDPAKYIYVSPYIGSTELVPIKYHEITAVVDDEFRITVSLDGNIIIDSTFPKSDKKRIKVPYSTVGKNMQIEIQSSGTLSELLVTYS